MLFRLVAVATLVASLLLGRPVLAAIVGDASVSYSATRTVTVDGKNYPGKVFHTPGKEREDVDINGIPATFILDLDGSEGAVILPALVSYLEFPLPPLLAQLDRRRLNGKAVGEERLNGVGATKYRLDYTASDGTRGEGYLWLSRDNILLRIEGRVLRPHHRPMVLSMALSDRRFGPQAGELN